MIRLIFFANKLKLKSAESAQTGEWQFMGDPDMHFSPVGATRCGRPVSVGHNIGLPLQHSHHRRALLKK